MSIFLARVALDIGLVPSFGVILDGDLIWIILLESPRQAIVSSFAGFFMRTIRGLSPFVFGFPRSLITPPAYRIGFLKSNSGNDILPGTHFIHLSILNDFLAILRTDFIEKGITLMFRSTRIKVFF